MTTKLRLIFLIIVLIPQGIMFVMAYKSPLAANQYFNQIQAFCLASSFLLALGLPGLTVRWLVGKYIDRLRQLCLRVKQGEYRELLSLANEARDGDGEDQMTSLMRDMNWMARQIEIRERDLQQAVSDLVQSRKQIDEQNKYLTAVNAQLVDAQMNLSEQAAELDRACKSMQVMAMTDPLTQMANRRRFFDALDENFQQLVCGLRPISLLILDIDHFKAINDSYGHQAGDKVLQEIADVIQGNIRNSDLAARIGGEEYAILMTDASSEAAAAIAKKIKKAIEAHEFSLDENRKVFITVSIGVCTLTQRPCCFDVEKLYGFADQALYHSKHNGRNSVSVYSTATSSIDKVA